MFDINQVRADFPILDSTVNGHPLVYLDSGASAQKPQCVIDAVADYYRHHHANVHRGVHTLSQLATDQFEAARESSRAFLNAAHLEEVIFTKGTTESINLLAHSFAQQFLGAGDEIIVSRMEHHANIVPWQMVCQQQGATLRVIDVSPSGELDMTQFRTLLNEKTKLVAVTHISNVLGTVNPVAEIIQLSRQNNTRVFLDGAQVAPHGSIDVQALDVDFYAFSAHKVFGPTGIGVLYGKRELLDAMPPYQGGGNMIKKVSFEGTTYNELPHKFEAGTPNIAGCIGMKVALDYVRDLDMQGACDHEQELLQYVTTELNAIDGVRIYGSAADKMAVVSFLLEGAHPFDVGMILDKLGVAVRTGHHCCQPLMDFYEIPGTVRASFTIYNTMADAQALVAAVKRAARMLL